MLATVAAISDLAYYPISQAYRWCESYYLDGFTTRSEILFFKGSQNAVPYFRVITL